MITYKLTEEQGLVNKEEREEVDKVKVWEAEQWAYLPTNEREELQAVFLSAKSAQEVVKFWSQHPSPYLIDVRRWGNSILAHRSTKEENVLTLFFTSK